MYVVVVPLSNRLQDFVAKIIKRHCREWCKEKPKILYLFPDLFRHCLGSENGSESESMAPYKKENNFWRKWQEWKVG